MFNIKSNKLSTNIVVISDIHYHPMFKDSILNYIIDEIKKIKPKYLCIPGDIVDESIYCDDRLFEFFKTLSKYTKIIISLGNHDISKIVKRKQIYYENKKWFNDLNKLNNVIVLDNEQYIDNNIMFTGYTLGIENTKYNDNPMQFLKDLNKLNFKNNNKTYNILLSHSPQNILGNKKLYQNEFIKNTDLILCGHMHNGIIPHKIEKIIKGNRGIIGPHKKLLPKYSRGMFSFNNTILIISKGITKISKSVPKILHPLNKLYPIEIEIINIEKSI